MDIQPLIIEHHGQTVVTRQTHNAWSTAHSCDKRGMHKSRQYRFMARRASEARQ